MAIFITYLSGDCYIDQTLVTQTSRSALAAGCVDTAGILGGPGGTLAVPLGTDFNALTGAVSGFSNSQPWFNMLRNYWQTMCLAVQLETYGQQYAQAMHKRMAC